MERLATRMALAALLGGCGAGDGGPRASTRLQAAIAEQVRQGPGSRVVLAELVESSWQRVYIFGPYTPLKTLRDSLGLADDATARQQGKGIDSRDDVTLLVFWFPDGRLESVALPRAQGDFGPELVGRSYERSEARFRVRPSPAGSWGTIGPEA